MKMLKRFRHPAAGLVWVGLLTAATFTYAMFQGGFVSWFLFYSTVTVFLFTTVVALLPMDTLHVTRELNRETLVSGATMRVTVKIMRTSRFPLLYLIVNDRLHESFQTYAEETSGALRKHSRALFFPGLKRSVHFTYTVGPMPRGEYDLGGIELKTGDMFGFLQKSRTVVTEQRILVFPRYESIRSWDTHVRHDEGSRQRRNAFHYDITSVAGVRDYEPGDRLSWLDWKSTARMNKLLTKEFERPLNEDAIVCLDGCANHYDEHDERFERAVTAAASLVRDGLRRGSAVGFVSLAKEVARFPPASGNEQLWRVFYHLAKVKADGEGMIPRRMAQMFHFFPANVSVCYVTPVVDEALLQLAEFFYRRKQAFNLLLIATAHESASIQPGGMERLARIGTNVHFVEVRGFDEKMKAGIRHATS